MKNTETIHLQDMVRDTTTGATGRVRGMAFTSQPTATVNFVTTTEKVVPLGNLEKVEVKPEWPSYCVDSMNRRLEAIRGSFRRMPLHRIEESHRNALVDEVQACRAYVDRREVDNDFWCHVGNRTITEAWAREVRLATFKAALEAPDFARVTAGHPVSPGNTNVYRQERTPTGVQLVCSLPSDWPETAELVSGHSVVAGGHGSPYRP